MMEEKEQKEIEKQLGRSGIEAAILIPNLILVGVVILYLMIARLGPDRVGPLVTTDSKTSRLIADLERKMARQGLSRGEAALELAKLYQRAGEMPWSYDALKAAEEHGGDAPPWRMKLGLAYLEITKNRDGLRVLKQTLDACVVKGCPANTRARLEIYKQIAKLFVERNINARTDPAAAHKVFDEVVKPVDAKQLLTLLDKKKKAAKVKTEKTGASKPRPAR